MNNTPVTLIDYNIDKESFLKVANELKKNSKPYTDDRYPGYSHDKWSIEKYEGQLANKIMMDFGVFGKGRFYWLEPFAEIPEHVDNKTLCSLNFILSDEAAPITINGKEYFYEQCLLDTQQPHSVTNGPKERIMFKISIFSESYDEVLKRLKYKK